MFTQFYTYLSHICTCTNVQRLYFIDVYVFLIFAHKKIYIYIYIHTYLYLDGRCIKENEMNRKLGLCCKLGPVRSYNVSTGGGPGIMEAANRGAHEAGDTTLGFGASRPEHFGCNKYFLLYT